MHFIGLTKLEVDLNLAICLAPEPGPLIWVFSNKVFGTGVRIASA